MRHKVFGRRLGRDINQRSALLRNLTSAILLSGYVVTTQAKAKFAKVYIEKLIKNSQKNSLAVKRDIAAVLTQKALVKLVTEIGPGMTGRNGGYTRIIKINSRKGDNAPMVKLELVEWDKTKTIAPKKLKKPKVKKEKTKSPAKKLKQNLRQKSK